MPPAPFSHIDLRCPLFIPGNRRDMLWKAGRYSPSAYMPDLEDSVPSANKVEARKVTADALPSLFGLGKPVVPRVNSLSTGLTGKDLEAVVGPYVVGISIGKVKTDDDIAVVDGMLSELERDRWIESGSIGILPWLETASAIVNAYAICNASERVKWVAFGAEDFSADMGISRAVDLEDPSVKNIEDYGEASLLYARSAVAVAGPGCRRGSARHAVCEISRSGWITQRSRLGAAVRISRQVRNPSGSDRGD